MASICFDNSTVRPVRCYWIPTSLKSIQMTQEGPNRPEPQPLKLDGKTTAIAVLDLSRRCENPQEVCSNLMIPLAEFLDRAGRPRCRSFTLFLLPVRGHRSGKSPRRSSDENQSPSSTQTPSTNLWAARLRRSWTNGIAAL